MSALNCRTKPENIVVAVGIAAASSSGAAGGVLAMNGDGREELSKRKENKVKKMRIDFAFLNWLLEKTNNPCKLHLRHAAERC